MKTKLLLTLLLLTVCGAFTARAEEEVPTRFECVADTWIRESSPTDVRGTAVDVEFGVDGNSSRYALLGFNLAIEPGKRVKSANLVFITKVCRTSPEGIVYGYNHEFEESTNWQNEQSYVQNAIKVAPINKFTLAGQNGIAIYDDGKVKIEFQDIEKWTNRIDVSSYLRNFTAADHRVNFMINLASAEKSSIYSKENTGEKTIFTGTDAAREASREELLPYLEVVLEDIPSYEEKRFECVADTWIRENNATWKDGAYAATVEANKYRFSILSGFDFTPVEGKQIKSATLHFVTARHKGNTLNLYAYPQDFEETTTWENEASTINRAVSVDPLVKFVPAGQWNKDLADKGINEDMQSLDKWVNEIDVTTYLRSLPKTATRVNFYFEGASDQECFYSKDNKGTDAFKNEDNTFNSHFEAAELMPYLVVRYEANEPSVIGTVGDTHIRTDNAASNATSASMEIKNVNNGAEFYGLLQFNLPLQVLDTENYEVIDANLRLVCVQNKGDRWMDLYDYPRNFAESTNYTTEQEYVAEALTGSPIVKSFQAQGQGTKAISDDGILEQYRTVDAWTSNVDVTNYISNKANAGVGTVNLMLKKTNTHNDAMRFASREATDISSKAGESYSFTFKAEDLVPQLTITVRERHDLTLTHTFDGNILTQETATGLHKHVNTLRIKAQEGIDYSQLDVNVKRVSEAELMVLSADEDYTVTKNWNSVDVTLNRAGTYVITPALADGSDYTIAAGSNTPKTITINPLTLAVAADTEEYAWSNDGNQVAISIASATSDEVDYDNIKDDITFTFEPYFNGEDGEVSNPETLPAERPSNFDPGFWDEMMSFINSDQNVDGYYSEISDYTYDGTDLSLQFPCSGLYKVTMTSTDSDITFGDESSWSKFITVYPSTDNSFKVTASNGEEYENTFNINGIIANAESQILYPYESQVSGEEAGDDDQLYDSETLQYAFIYTPGVYLADLYWKADDVSPYEASEAAAVATDESLEGYTLYNPFDKSTHPNISNLEARGDAGYQFNIVLVKNGVQTPANDAIYTIIASREGNLTGVEAVEAEGEGEAEYYTLQGVKVANPAKGVIYIKVVDGKASKVVM